MAHARPPHGVVADAMQRRVPQPRRLAHVIRAAQRGVDDVSEAAPVVVGLLRLWKKAANLRTRFCGVDGLLFRFLKGTHVKCERPLDLAMLHYQVPSIKPPSKRTAEM